jgi:alpha-L-glutamate ligase-like protein
MPKASDILGMNARNQDFVSHTSKMAKSIANSKIATNVLLEQKGIATPKIYGLFATAEDVQTFDWEQLTENFVIKPTNGLAGKGVVVFRKKVPGKLEWADALGRNWQLSDIELHCFDILEGQYSRFGPQHNVIIQERVPIHPTFRRFVFKGTPDIRVIVYNKVPVMAMLRLPTKESEGRANVHQGAIAAGIDIASGITTAACTGKGRPIEFVPETKIKLRGLKIPSWKACLRTAVAASEAAEMPYSGVDLFLHPDKGPMVVELNAQPGLTIQIANQAGLRRRLERVRDLNVLNADHGVKVGQALFAASFSDSIISEEGLTILNATEKVVAYGANKQFEEVNALINTGRLRTAISEQLAKDLHLIDPDNLLWYQQEKKEGLSPVVEISIKIKQRKIKTAAVVLKRLNKASQQIEIGRRDLGGYLVSSSE